MGRRGRVDSAQTAGPKRRTKKRRAKEFMISKDEREEEK
jgi:hypothetical protein